MPVDQIQNLLTNPQALNVLTGVFLFFVGLAAGFVDSIAGGGGILTLPALLAAGLPPHFALGTNKLQSTFGSLTAMLKYRSAGLLKLRTLVPGISASIIGAIGGTWAVTLLDPGFLSKFIPYLLVAVFLFVLFKPAFGIESTKPRMPLLLFWILAGFLISFYDGFLGPGTGTFWALALVSFAGMDLQSATAHTKVGNFTSNIVSLVVFFFAGSVVLAYGLLMGVGQIIGAFFGSRLVLKKGVSLVRVVFLIMTGAVIVYLFYRQFF